MDSMDEAMDFAEPAGMEKKISEMEKMTAGEMEQPLMERLHPGSALHKDLLEHLLARLHDSEDAMSAFYARWRANETRVQAYINLPDFEKQLKEMSASGAPPKLVQVTIPYSFATISTIVTYIVQVFTGRKPIFQVNTHQKEQVEAARMMEILLQYNADHVRLVRQFYQFINDSQVYGLGIMRTQWKKEVKSRTVWSMPQQFMGMGAPGTRTKSKQDRTTFEGTCVDAVDPFMFFPDPNVPMYEVNKKGEYVFWRSFPGRHIVKSMEADKLFWWVEDAGTMPQPRANGYMGQSARNMISQGESHPGQGLRSDRGKTKQQTYQCDECSIELIPAEWKLGESTKPEKWLFTILNEKQIVRAEPLDCDHGMHPVVVTEPLSLGYGFGQPGMADYLGPFQDSLSWYMNSHIKNVRTALNNMFVVDPSMVEMQDLRNPEDGKLIRLKRAAMGMDVRQAISQLNVVDVTQNHTRDMELFMRMGQQLSSATDNLMGMQDAGGRKSATEARQGMQAASSRLAATAQLISAQAITDLSEQMCVNYQQNLETDFLISVVGQQGVQTDIHVNPESLVGDFNFPVHDGTLPLDRVALLDVWKEILMGVAQDQELRMTFSLPEIFEYVAELGGAQNVGRFKMAPPMQPQLNVVPDEEAQAQAQAGNISPIDALGGGRPADRLIGGLG